MLQDRSAQTEPADWRRQGVCADLDPELFFPEPDQPATEALAACARCTVRRECLTTALLTGEAYGVWGGTTEQDRQKPLGKKAPTAPRPRPDDAAA